jgi:hypothetical protein
MSYDPDVIVLLGNVTADLDAIATPDELQHLTADQATALAGAAAAIETAARALRFRGNRAYTQATERQHHQERHSRTVPVGQCAMPECRRAARAAAAYLAAYRARARRDNAEE